MEVSMNEPVTSAADHFQRTKLFYWTYRERGRWTG